MKQEHFEILLEEMNSKFNLVLEGHQSLRTEMGEMKTELKQDIELFNFKIDTLNQKIDGFEDKLTKKIDGVEEKLSQKIDGVAADLKAHRQDTELHYGVYKVRE